MLAPLAEALQLREGKPIRSALELIQRLAPDQAQNTFDRKVRDKHLKMEAATRTKKKKKKFLPTFVSAKAKRTNDLFAIPQGMLKYADLAGSVALWQKYSEAVLSSLLRPAAPVAVTPTQQRKSLRELATPESARKRRKGFAGAGSEEVPCVSGEDREGWKGLDCAEVEKLVATMDLHGAPLSFTSRKGGKSFQAIVLQETKNTFRVLSPEDRLLVVLKTANVFQCQVGPFQVSFTQRNWGL